MRRILVGSFLLVLVAGCTGHVVTPRGAFGTWTHTDAVPLVSYRQGCGFCIADADYVAVDVTVVFANGQVFWFDYALGTAANRSNPDVRPDAAPYRDEILRLMRPLDLLFEPHNFTVHHARSGSIDDATWTRIDRLYEAAIDDVTDPGDPKFDCVDCGGTQVQVFSKHLSVVLYPKDKPWSEHGNYREGDAWDDIQGQTRLIRDWIHPT